MKKNSLKIFFLIVMFFMVPGFAKAAEDLSRITSNGGLFYFAHDFESGNIAGDVQNGSSISWLGGNPAKPLADYSSNCTADTTNFHYSYFSNVTSGQDSVFGSQESLITPYLGNCPNEAFLRDTTVIRTPLLSEYYVRWYQKWTGSFEASVQQKFSKFYNSDNLNEKTLTGHLSMRPNNSSGNTPGATIGTFEDFLPNLENHFNKDGCSPASGNIWIVPGPFGGCYTGQARGYDDFDSTNSPITFDLDIWYLIEVHSKLNSDVATADAVYDLWIDGVLRLGLRNFKFRDGNLFNTPGTDQFEFQHVYYNRSHQDQSTYMDNIVIAPSAPTGLGVV